MPYMRHIYPLLKGIVMDNNTRNFVLVAVALTLSQVGWCVGLVASSKANKIQRQQLMIQDETIDNLNAINENLATQINILTGRSN
jgi:hypothetical protein